MRSTCQVKGRLPRCRTRLSWVLGLALPLGLATVAGSELVLSDQQSEVYYRFAIVAGGGIKVDKDTEIAGNLHSNDEIELKKDVTVTGDVSAVGEVKVEGTVVGTVTEGADPVALPLLLDEAELRVLADRVFEQDTRFQDEVVEDVVFVDGKVRICGGLGGAGTIIATRDVDVEGAGGVDVDEAEDDGGLECEGSPRVAPLKQGSRISLISLGRITIGKDRSFRGVLRAGRDVELDQGSSFAGVIVADRKVDVGKDSLVAFVDFDEVPPAITLLAPEDGSVSAVAQPVILVALSDDFSGVRLESLELSLDGTDRTAEATVSGGIVRFQPSTALPSRRHILGVAVSDHSDNTSQAEFRFTVDTLAPLLEIVEPGASPVINDDRPAIEAVYVDPGAGVDLESVAVEVDGRDVTSGCGLSESSVSCEPPLAAGLHTVSVTVADRVGNVSSASSSFELLLDVEPPAVTITGPLDGSFVRSSTVRVSGTATDGDRVVRIEVDGRDAVFDGTGFTADVELGEGANAIVAAATDRAGNRGTAAVSVVRDLTPPSLAITSPVDGQLVNTASVRVAGEARDDFEVAAVEIDGRAAPLADGRFDDSVAVAEGSNTILVRAVDAAGNAAQAAVEVTRLTVPGVTITAPESLTLVTDDEVTVTGTVADSSATVRVNGVAASRLGDAFTAAGIPIVAGANLLVAVATSPSGAQASASATVFRDLAPPRVTISSPVDGEVVHEAALAVSGLVNDVVLGTVNARQATVEVNGVPAAVSNRCFLAEAVPLDPGENTIRVVAVDGSGNAGEATVRVSFEPAAGPALRRVSGQLQSAAIGTTLAAPLVAELVDGAGDPIAGRPMIFKVMDGDGHLDGRARRLAVATDGAGRAAVSWTVGSRAGVGNQTVEALVVGVGSVLFTASALAAEPAAIYVDSGDQQTGGSGQRLPAPLVAIVTDTGFNRLAGVPVTFRVVKGGGRFSNGLTELVVATDSDGRAGAVFDLGPDEGTANNVVETTFSDAPDAPPASFVASGRAAGDPAATSVSGLVLDNTDRPVPGVAVVLEGTGLATATDADGAFRIGGAPVGTFHLRVDGSSAQRPGPWPSLVFVITTIAGRDNRLGRPIYLLPLDLANGLFVSGTEGGLLTLPKVPGFSLDIEPGSVTFPDGGHSGLVSVTVVHGDKVPMVPNFGQQPRFIVTIQPSGARFDPPARMTLPNVDGLPPGAATELYSFDHDLGSFVSIGPGTVSDDGMLVVSNPGVGVIEAGWHCGGNPAASGTPHNCPQCQTCKSNRCVPVGGGCDDGNECTSPDRCSDGACIGEPRQILAVDAKADGEDELAVPPETRVQLSAEVEQKNCSLDYEWDFGDGAMSASPSPSHIYAEPGTYTTTVTVTCGSCASQTKTAAVRVEVVDLEILEVVSDKLIAGSRCNRLPPLNGSDKNRPMLMGAATGNTAAVSLGVRVDPPASFGRAKVGVREAGSGTILDDAPAAASPTLSALVFTALPGRRVYELVAGLDRDGDGSLEEDEVTDVFTDGVRVVTELDYEAAILNVRDLDFFLLYDIAGQMASVFLGDQEAPEGATTSTTTVGAADTTHPLGAVWDSSTCKAQVRHFNFDPASDVSQTVAESSQVEDLVKKELEAHRDAVLAFFATPGSPPRAVFPRALEQPPWEWGGQIGTADWLLSLDPHPGIAFAFGHVTLGGPIREVEVEKSSLDVTRIVYEGSFTDLYDFDYTELACREAATVEAGFSTLGGAGRIAVSTVDLRRDAAGGITGFSFSFD